METIIKKIQDLYQTSAYQKLNAYYEQQTVYNMLGVERNENRHSKFIAWLLNPNESHSLKEFPLRRFLSLVAASATDEYKCYYQDEVRTRLVTGNYELSVEEIATEQSIVGLVGNDKSLDSIVERNEHGSFKSDSQNRFDIWLMLKISFKDSQENDVIWHIPVILENKIYSKEGNASNPERAQTVRYSQAMGVICHSRGLSTGLNPYCQPLMVYLTPSEANGPVSQEFIHLTYQQLLDYVISPASLTTHLQNVTTDAQVMIDGYIRNLSCPMSSDDKDYSILAISQDENENLEKIYMSDAFQTAFCAIYGDEAKRLLGDALVEVEMIPMIEDFWNCNEDLFKVVLYNHFKSDAEELKVASKVVKTSNRDNTRYWVTNQDGERLNTNGKAASKSEASYLIFKAYCQKWTKENPGKSLTVKDLRSAFPGKMNEYYHNRYLMHLFYDIDGELCNDAKASKHYGTPLQKDGNGWDFYWDDSHKLPNVQPSSVRNVKMWRKDDFDRLVRKAQEYGIAVEPNKI